MTSMTVGARLPHPQSMPGIGLLVLCQTLAALGVGSWYGVKSTKLALHGETTQGTVVDWSKPTSKGFRTPIIEFSTRTGQRVRFEGQRSTQSNNPTTGAPVPVRYSPADPSINTVDSFDDMWILPVIFLPIGVIGAIAATILLSLGQRRIRARAHAKKTGVHVPAVVVGASPVAMRGTSHYEPLVEIRDPQTGAPVRCKGDRQRLAPAMGSQAIVHIEQMPPHRYFVEMP